MGRLKNDNASRRIRQDELETDIVKIIIQGIIRQIAYEVVAEKMAIQLAMKDKGK